MFDLFLKFVFTFTLIWFFSGVIKFPDSPIKMCGEDMYCGKQGQHHTKEDFDDYKKWWIINSVSFPILFVLFAVRERKKRKDESKAV